APAVPPHPRALLVDAFGISAVEVVAPVPRVRDAAGRLAPVTDDRPNRASVAIEDVERHRLAPAQDEGDDGQVASALAHGREDAIDLCAGDGATLALQPLGGRDSGRGRTAHD